MPLEWKEGVIKQIRQATPNTKIFDFQIPAVEKFDFVPGQFITFDMPIHEQRNKRWRSYSIASHPSDTNTVELAISYLEGGLASDYLFNQVAEGQSILCRGPQGVFTLPQEIDRDLFFICTGTGIAPFRSMLKSMAIHPIPHKSIHLIFGCRTQEDLLFAEEMRLLEGEIENFHYHPVLSRESWDGAQGYVHAVYEQLCSERQEALFYLCGWKMMVDEAKERIQAMGYDKKAIKLELYG